MTTSRILVVDDDPDILEATTLFWRSEGYQVVTATDGQEALTKLAAEPWPALILLDLMMPVMNGLEFLTQLRQLPRGAEMPVMVLSAAHDGQRQAATLGVEDYLTKPYDLDLLIERISQRLSQRFARPVPLDLDQRRSV